jgi:hypothetical protein
MGFARDYCFDGWEFRCQSSYCRRFSCTTDGLKPRNRKFLPRSTRACHGHLRFEPHRWAVRRLVGADGVGTDPVVAGRVSGGTEEVGAPGTAAGAGGSALASG